MSDLLQDGIHIARRGNYSESFIEQWCGLVRRCFGYSKDDANRLFKKYLLNDSKIAYLMKDGIMVAAYCGLKLCYQDAYIFLSTDTMSDGTKIGSSVILGKRLYKSLVSDNVSVVCGYPNNSIRKIREKGLGWVINGELYLYVGIPMVWHISMAETNDNTLWKVIRPEGGWFTRKPPFFVNLFGRDGLYSSRFGLVITLSSYRPGLFFVRVPSFLFQPRLFGYKLLTENNEKNNDFFMKIKLLDLDTIDIP